MEGDSTYFGRRAREERLAAGSAGHPAARQAHLDLAERYEDLASSIDSRQAVLGLQVDSARA